MSIHVTSMVWRARLGSQARKAVAGKLGDCANDEGRSCYPSIDRIAREAEVSPRTVQRSIREFERVGLLVLEREGGGRSNTNRYRFDMALLKRLAEHEVSMAGTGLAVAIVPWSETADEAVDNAENGDTVAGFDRQENGDTLSPFMPERVTLTSVNPARVSPEPSRIRQESTLSPSETDASRERASGKPGEGQGTASGQDLDILIPDERRPLLAVLRADGVHRDVVEHFIRPMLSMLAVPPGKDGPTYVRVLRDAAAAADACEAALAQVAQRFAIDRVRDLPWPKDVEAPLRAAHTARLMRLEAGDPRWAAWLHHDRQDAKKSAYAAYVERNRQAYAAPADWPPGSAEVEQVGGAWFIPWATAEHVAWLAVWRRTGRTAEAQSADVGKRGLRKPSRWPELALAPSLANRQPAENGGTP